MSDSDLLYEKKLREMIKNEELFNWLDRQGFLDWTVEEYEMRRKHVTLTARMDIDKELYPSEEIQCDQ